MNTTLPCQNTSEKPCERNCLGSRPKLLVAICLVLAVTIFVQISKHCELLRYYRSLGGCIENNEPFVEDIKIQGCQNAWNLTNGGIRRLRSRRAETVPHALTAITIRVVCLIGADAG